MKYSFNLSQALIFKFILILFLLNPIKTAEAKIEAHSIEEVATQHMNANSKKKTLFKKVKPRKERRKWNDLSYGEKSFRMSLFALLSVLLIPIGGIGFLALVVCTIISVRLGLRSLKEKEEGISRTKRNQGIAISLSTLLAVIILFGLLFILFFGILF